MRTEDEWGERDIESETIVPLPPRFNSVSLIRTDEVSDPSGTLCLHQTRRGSKKEGGC